MKALFFIIIAYVNDVSLFRVEMIVTNQIKKYFFMCYCTGYIIHSELHSVQSFQLLRRGN